MEERLLALVRAPQVMTALVSRRRRPFDLNVASPEPYVEVPIALSRVSPQTCPWKDKDDRAWRALANVPRMTERAALAMIRTIVGSVAAPDSAPGDLPALDPSAPPRDLRPHLCVARDEQLLLDSVADALAHSSRETDMPAWHWTQRSAIEAMPGEFRRLFLWSLHLSPWTDLINHLAAYDALGLDERPGLRSAMARLLSYAGAERALAWSGLVASLPEPRRVRAAELILETGAWAREPEQPDADALAPTAAAGADPDPAADRSACAQLMSPRARS